MKDFNKLMKQAQKKQAEMETQQSELHSREYSASSGGGMVTARVNGKMEILSLTIKPECVDPDDAEMLQDLIKAAVNEAIRKAREDVEQSQQAMAASMLSGLNLPGLG